MMTEALAVQHLSVGLRGAGARPIVEDVSFTVAPGEIMALVGESGSGKSMTALAVMGLIEPPLAVMAGSLRLAGQAVDHADGRMMRSLRGRSIAMIFQDPMMTLNPVMRIDEQICEAMFVHDAGLSRNEALSRAITALAMVGIPAPEERLRAYPHQLSGGMRQRVVIAIALINRPAVVIADEATTALDVTTQGQILFEARRLCRETGCAMLWITHDLAVVANLADSIAVMYGGRIVEQGPAETILAHPRHPYTKGLLDSVPRLEARLPRLRSIPGLPPLAGGAREGCRFAPRCSRAEADCRSVEPLLVQRGESAVRCHHPLGEVASP
jgi:peptide/nickel transport system ATP-binding protein